MTTYHARMLALLCDHEHSESNVCHARTSGNNSAVRACAEIANEADAECERLRVQVRQADERGDEAMRRAHAAELMAEQLDAKATRLMAILHVERMTDNALIDNDTPAMHTALESAREQLAEAWREMVDVLGTYKVSKLRAALGEKP
jgi:K+-sensing histidine kinase KdpD